MPEAENEAIRMILAKVTEKGLQLSENKSRVVLMTGKRQIEPVTIKVGDSPVQQVDEAKYLGIWISKRHVQETSKGEQNG